jgi:hypothetical protein
MAPGLEFRSERKHDGSGYEIKSSRKTTLRCNEAVENSFDAAVVVHRPEARC